MVTVTLKPPSVSHNKYLGEREMWTSVKVPAARARTPGTTTFEAGTTFDAAPNSLERVRGSFDSGRRYSNETDLFETAAPAFNMMQRSAKSEFVGGVHGAEPAGPHPKP